MLNSLRNKSLLHAAGSRRFDMHALVQQFSAEVLAAESHYEGDTRRAHSKHYMTMLSERAIALDTRDARSAADQIQPDWENALVAWHEAARHGQLTLLENALDGLVHFCNLRGLFREAQLALERTLTKPALAIGAPNAPDDAARQNLRCRLLTAQAYFAERPGLTNAVSLAQEALALATQIGNDALVVSNHIIQANAAEFAGNYSQCKALVEHAPHTLAFGLAQLAEAQMAVADLKPEYWDTATTNFIEAIATFQALERLALTMESQIGLAELERRQGNLRAALDRIMPILPHLPTIASEGWDEPIRAFLVCAQILRAAHDPQAEAILERGLRLLNDLASKIIDPDLHKNFLSAIPAHRDLRAMRLPDQQAVMQVS